MAEREIEEALNGDELLWLVSIARCVICANQWMAAYQLAAPEDALECPSCGATDSEIAERIGTDRNLDALIARMDKIILHRLGEARPPAP